MNSKWLNKIFKKWLNVGVLVLIAVIFRATLPLIIKNEANKRLSDLGAYTGRIDDVDLALYRLAVSVQRLEIRKKDSNLPPLLTVKDTFADLSWRALFRGDLSVDIEIDEAVVTLSDSLVKGEKQLGTEENWVEVFKKVVPIRIETLSIVNSSVKFSVAGVPIPIKIEKLALEAHDLTTRPKRDLSPFTMSAEVQGHAGISMSGRVSALTTFPPKADIDFTLKNFEFSSVNKVLRKYVPIDITKGKLNLYSEVATANWDVMGYSKVFLRDADIIAPRQDFISGRHFIFEILGAFGNWFLKNSKTKTVAFFAPFEIRNKKINVDTGEAFWSSVKNSNESLKQGIDNSVTLEKLGGHEMPKHRD